jgi:hypothetical protein
MVAFVDVPTFVSRRAVTRVVASDPAGVTRVELFLDDMRVSAVEFAPFDASWDASGFTEGVHTLKALAFTSDGRTGSATIPIGIDHTPPEVAVPATAQRDGQFAIDATDKDAGVARVIVQRGDQPLKTLTVPPFTFAWPGGHCGSLELRVVAIDRAENESEAVVTVNATDTHDLDCDGAPALAFGGADCDDSSTAYGPSADDPGSTLVDFNCDGVPGIDADRDGVPGVATGGTDCDDGAAGTHGAWRGWVGSTVKLGDGTRSPAFVAMDVENNLLNVAFVDGGLFFGRADRSRGAAVTTIDVELVAVGANAAVDQRPALLRMISGGFAIVFFAGNALKVATRGSSGPWTIAEIDPGSDAPLKRADVVSDAEDKLHVVYEVRDVRTGALSMRYATDRSGSWSTQTLPEQLGPALDSVKIAVDGARRPHVIYENLTALRHAVLNEDGWTSNTVFPDRQQVSLYALGPDTSNNPRLVAAVRSSVRDELRAGSINDGFVLNSFAFTSVPEQIIGFAINRSEIVFQLASRTTGARSVMALDTFGNVTQRLHSSSILGSTSAANSELRVLLGLPASAVLASIDRRVLAPFDELGGPDADCDGTP